MDYGVLGFNNLHQKEYVCFFMGPNIGQNDS